MGISPATYERVALEDAGTAWELVCGKLRAKPAMTLPHNDLAFELAYRLRSQLDHAAYHVRCNSGRASLPGGNYYVPDVMVVPVAMTERFRGAADRLEAYGEPLPLVVEVWSPSTGDYDVLDKLPEYQRRGDAEIWLIHPFDRAVRAWRRQPDGSYVEEDVRGGIVAVASLPGVTIDLDALFGLA